MLDYDLEAPIYDATRGGVERAEAAAEAVAELLPAQCPVLLDVACGTGIVAELLRVHGRTVVGVDMSAGMLAYAKPRLEGRVARGDATRLPVADESADAVTFMWLLHLVPAEVVAAAVAEAARVLRPGGVLVTTVNKNTAAYQTPSDVADILYPAYREHVPAPSDDMETVTAEAARAGLTPAGTAGYIGLGQGRTPRTWAEKLHKEFAWAREADPAQIAELRARLAELPEQDVLRPDPVYKLAAFRKG